MLRAEIGDRLNCYPAQVWYHATAENHTTIGPAGKLIFTLSAFRYNYAFDYG